MKRQTTDENTGGPSRARDMVDYIYTSNTGSQSRYINISSCQSTGGRAGARVRVGRPIANREHYFKAWRNAVWGGDFDPVAVAVDEAVALFASAKDPAGQKIDRDVWLKIANRVGLDSFLDAFDQMRSETANSHKQLRNPAAAFQLLLNRRFPKNGGTR